MATINQLTAIDAFQSGDNLAVYDASNNDARKGSISLLQTYLQANLTHPNFTTQYEYITATPGTSTIAGTDNVHLILILSATIAAVTITIPGIAVAVDKQEIIINATDVITTLTIAASGATVLGEPSSMAANDYFRLKYDTVTQTWYRIG